ncbi:MAG TPA: hypothetical protein PKW08_13690 [Flavobacteriaceae bacterium]|nr:hypothetical protein [Flavobacteriaceae bacterium]HPF12454.1 hypothetical protein [Flavobacteriaceae bacterium]HQU22634.1 hypothetical protein [Flavobacteriaceae bacterium]HQU66212.1 hypothetical protein [Flavobacteriaceae bacterium]
MNIVKKVIHRIFNKLGYRLVSHKTRPSLYGACKVLKINYGHEQTVLSKTSIDADGNHLPWFTYPSIEYLNQIDFSSKVMLEWGSGNSSKYFSQRVKEIYSIEHHTEWYEIVKSFQLPNQKLFLVEDDYATLPITFKKHFDIILIDGTKRHDCANASFNLLAPGGLIILDNSDRYPDISKQFRDQGFIEVDFHGFGPINEYTWTTSLFFHKDIKLNPLKNQPEIPIGGGY